MLYRYLEFINEDFYDNFKSKYAKLFNESDEDIKKELDILFKKIDDETDFLKVVNIFDDFLSSNQKTLNSKIENSQGQEAINKLLSDNLKTIYFALKSIIIKLDDKDFTDIFEKSKDKNLRNLMNMKQDKFSDAVPVYVKDYMIPQIEKMSNTQKVQKVQEADEISTQPVQNQPQAQPQTQPQQDKTKQLETYKTKSKEWFNYVYGMTWDKLKTVKNKMNTSRLLSSNIDQISKLMKNSTNEEAKKQLLKKITSLTKEELNKIGDILKINKEEIGEF